MKDPSQIPLKIQIPTRNIPNAQQQVDPKINYLNESAKVTEGSSVIDKNYSVTDFAKLAGVQSIYL